jgi:3-oxoadipate enol-lactonase
MPFHAIRDITMYSECGGTGPRLLYINGSNGDLRTHPNVFDGPLPQHFEVLAYDQRGLGQTSKPDHEYTMADYAEDAAGLLAAYGWDSCHVMGVSFGGMVAQEFAIRFPGKVKRLVLSCSSSGGRGGSSYPIHEYFDLSAEQAARRSLGVTDIRRNAAWQAAHPEDVRAAIERRNAQLSRWAADPATEAGFRRQLAARWAHDTYDRLPLLSMPVLIVGGTYDGQAPPANQEVLHDLIPNSTLEFFEGAHGIFLQQDPRGMPRVIEFLNATS